jgi:hypothetical protein
MGDALFTNLKGIASQDAIIYNFVDYVNKKLDCLDCKE